MTIELRNVSGRPEPAHYSQLSIASGDRLVHVAGQTGTDEAGRVVDGGLRAQAERALLNVALALDEAGASDRDIAKLTIYVVDWEPAKFEQLGAGLVAAQQQRGWTAAPPVTLIGVTSLFEPDMLVEIEAVAVCATSGA
jgi:enamine deaminase RidA (YjgF/YER057c/UK114 family)